VTTATLERPPAKHEVRRFVADVGNVEKGWPQADFLFDREHFYSGYFGGVGIGKTLTLVHDAFSYAHECPGSRQIITEPTYQMIRDVLIPTINDEYGELEGRAFRMTRSPPFNLFGVPKSMSAPGRPTRRHRPWEIWLRSTQTGQRMYGPNIHRALMDEVTLGHQEEQAQILAQRCRNLYGGYPLQQKMAGTPKGRNWVWAFMIEHPRRDRPAYQAATEDNHHLPAEYIQRMLDFYGGWDNPLARQELGGQWLQLVGPVFPQFSRQVHCRELRADHTWRDFKKRVGGIDFGGISPTALIGAGVAHTGRVWAYAEFYKHQCTMDELVKEMNDWRTRHGITRWLADPSGKEEIKFLMHHGFDIEPATHGNDLKLRVQIMGRRLNREHDGLPGAYMTGACPNLVTESETLAWKRIKIPGRGMEIMNDEFERGAPDHAVDAFTNCLSDIDDPPPEVPAWRWKTARKKAA
jgi:hypothetical protein